MKKKLRIALGHVKHYAAGKHSGFMPVGIGYIGAYAISQLGAHNVDLRLYENPDWLLRDIDAWRPDILGLAHYSWNSDLSALIFRHAKKRVPQVVCVGGGPDFPIAGNEQVSYLRERPEVDFFASFEGEIPFALLAKQIQEGVALRLLKNTPQAGFVSLHPESGALLTGEMPERLVDLDAIPSPYVMGLMDHWFDGQHPPSIETTRGCPYSCGFCTQGEKRWSKLARFSLAHLKEELEYIARKMQAYPGVLLSICDSNFGMYGQDEPVADYLRHLQDTYGWPNAFDVTMGKSHHDRILKIVERLQNKMQVSLSVQTMHEPTLQAIRRKNLPLDKYLAIRQELTQRGMPGGAETIMPLPEETKESYLSCIKTMMDNGIPDFQSYTAMLLKGTYLATPECRRRYQMTTRFRIIPRQLGEYEGEKCFETEEVCVATKTFSFDDYVECRSFGLFATAYSRLQYSAFDPLIRILRVGRYEWLQRVADITKRGDSPSLSELHNDFLKEVVAELYNSKEEIYRIFSRPENYEKLLRGELGDNLMRKYTTRLLVSHFSLSVEVACAAIIELLSAQGRLGGLQQDFIRAFKQWMLATRDLNSAFTDSGYLQREEILELSYDVESWFKDGESGRPLEEYGRPVRYRLSSKADNASSILSDVRAIHGKDSELAIARFLNNWSPDMLWRECSAV